ncbi:MAG: glycosyltransferase family 8 protein [Planctomycetota bacterium]
MNGQSVHLATIVDGNMVHAAATMVWGAVQRSGGRVEHIHIIGLGLSETQRQRLERVVPGCNVHWLEQKQARRITEELPAVYHVPPISYTRLLLPDLLEGVDRVLYLDADLVVRANVAELWDLGTQGLPIAAVRDAGMSSLSDPNCLRYVSDELQDPEAMPFNAGVMLMDLKIWRGERLAEKVLEFLRVNQDRLNYADQDGLNWVLQGRWSERAMKWNVPLPLLVDADAYGIEAVAEDCLTSAYSAACIYHMFGQHKPWNSGLMHGFRRQWLEEFRRSGYFAGVPWLIWRSLEEVRAAWFVIRRRIRPRQASRTNDVGKRCWEKRFEDGEEVSRSGSGFLG